MFQASEESAASERRALELQIAHRDAELRALRAQIDPHFLFNSLNSVVGLMAGDVDQARAMCLRLAEFLRDSLTLGREARFSWRGRCRWPSSTSESSMSGSERGSR